MTQVDRKEHSSRHHVSRIGEYLDHPDSADGERRMRVRNRLDAIDQPRRAEQRILAQVHRRSTGMGLRALDRHFEPAHPLPAGNHPELPPYDFEYWPLLDVEFEES